MKTGAKTALFGIIVLVVANSTIAQVTLDAAALQVLESTNPDQFRRAKEIIRVASEQGCSSAAAIARTQLGVADVQCDPLPVVRPSDPPRARIKFSLGGKEYIYFLPTRIVREKTFVEEGLQRKSP